MAISKSLAKDWHTQEDVPAALEIQGGKLVMVSTGETPVFDLPDGTLVNLLEHRFFMMLWEREFERKAMLSVQGTPTHWMP